MNINLRGVKQAQGLNPLDLEKLGELLDVWQEKLARNQLKTKYYDYKNELKNLGIAIPEKLEDIDSVVGWPAKAVDELQVRSIFDGFTYDRESIPDLERLLDENRLILSYEQATQSQLINSCAFATLGRGDVGEPNVVISFHSAEMSSALWNYRKKRIDYGMTVVDLKRKAQSKQAEPVHVNMYTDTDVIEIKKDDATSIWTAEYKPHKMGRLLMEVMAYSPSLKRPFGKSRISRAVISLTDSAVRTRLRAELSSEFFTTPQKYLLGASDEDFDKPRWEAYIGNIFTAGKDEDGDVPRYGQLPQASMQPHTEYMRDLAARFASETKLPVGFLGVIHDQPSSAEALRTALEPLIIEAQKLNRVNGDALRTIAQMALCIKQDKAFSELTDEERAIMPHFKNPAMPSLVSQADAMVKIVAAAPWIAETEVFLEETGFDESTRKRLMSEKKKIQAEAQIMAQMQGGTQPQAKPATMYEISSIIKAFRAGKISKANAITLFAQIGVDEVEAMQILNDAKDIEETVDGTIASGSNRESNATTQPNKDV